MVKRSSTWMTATIMMQLWLAWPFLCLLFGKAAARLEGGYELKSRPAAHRQVQQTSASTIYLTLEELQNSGLRLSWSEDSDPLQLPAFYLSVFDTDGSLPASPSIATIQKGVDTFLTAELNALYDVNNQVRTCSTAVVTQTNAAASRRRLQGGSSSTSTASMGSQLETKVDVQFAYQPTPTQMDVEEKVASILQQSDKLQMYLVPNITALAVDDPELANLNAVYYLGWVPVATVAPTSAPDDADAVLDTGTDKAPTEDSMDTKLRVLLPLVITACVVVLIMSLLIFKKRRNHQREHTDVASINLMQEAGQRADRGHYYDGSEQRSYRNVSVNQIDVDGTDIFSVEATLTPTSKSPHSNRARNDTNDEAYENNALNIEESNDNITSSMEHNNTCTDEKSPTDGNDASSASNNTSTSSSNTSREIITFLKPGLESPRLTSPTALSGTVSGLGAMSTLGMDSPRATMVDTTNSNNSPGTSQQQTQYSQRSSPCGGGLSESKSVFSFLSGFTSRGEASTVVASNLTKPSPSNTRNKAASSLAVSSPTSTENGGYTPRSARSSLFTFSEEDEEGDSNDKIKRRNERNRQLAELVVKNSSSSADDGDGPGKQLDRDILEQYADRVETEATLVTSLDTEDEIRVTVQNSTSNQDDICPGGSSCASSLLLDKWKPKNGAEVDDVDEDSKGSMIQGADLVAHANLDIVNDLMAAEAEAQRQRRTVLPSPPQEKEKPFFSMPAWSAGFDECKGKSNVKGSITNGNVTLDSPPTMKYPPPHMRETDTPGEGLQFNSGPNTPRSTGSSGSKIIQLQWDNPEKASENKAAAAAFANQVAMASSHSGIIKHPSIPNSPTSMTGDTGQSDLRLSRQMLSPSSKNRVAAGSAGFADGTSSYQTNTAMLDNYVVDEEDDELLNQQDGGGQRRSFLQRFTGAKGKKQQDPVAETMTPAEAEEFIVGGKYESLASLQPLVTGSMPSPENDSIEYDNDVAEEAKQRSRIHAKHSGEDGSTNYQNETMGRYSVDNMGDDDNEEELIISSSPRASEADSRKRRMRMSLSQVVFGSKDGNSSIKPPMSPRVITSPKSPMSRASYSSPHSVNSSPQSGSASKQLISDLLWLEQKIAATNQATSPRTNEKRSAPRGDLASPSDSLSFASHDDGQTKTDANNHSSGSSEMDRTSDPNDTSSGSSASLSLNQSIICRDCYAPPGKLKIVIHSTKDGPAVHTVKKGSSLEGHIFPGDLIISVDNVDTRTYSAEQVMKMMTAKTRFERKITVLHFEDDATTSS